MSLKSTQRLKSTQVLDLPLNSLVSYSKDISAFTTNMLSDISFSPDTVMDMKLSAMLSAISDTMSKIIYSFGGSVEAQKYRVRFYEQDGTLISEQCDIMKGFAAEEPEHAEIDNYTFIGWSKPFWNLHSDVDTYAQYERNRCYTVKFYADESNKTPWSSCVVYEGKDAELPPDPYKEGHLFAGWIGTYTKVTSDSDIHPYFIEDPDANCTVSFIDGCDGSTLKTVNIHSGCSAVLPDVVQHEGYKFIGWSKSPENITASTDISAVYQAERYEVSFTLFVNDEDVLLSNPSLPMHRNSSEQIFAEVADAYDPVIISYRNVYEPITRAKAAVSQLSSFSMNDIVWHRTRQEALDDITGTAGEDVDVVDQDTVLQTAEDHRLFGVLRCSPGLENKYAVKFMDGDEVVGLQFVLYNGEATPPAISKPRFNGWDGSFRNITSDVTLHAVYNAS